MVLTYGVATPTSMLAQEPRASLTTVSSRCCPRSGPSSRRTASSASSHSCVSWGSASRGITAMSVVLEVLGVVGPDVWQVRQDHAQVVAESSLGGVGLVAADGIDHGLVLADHLGDVARLGQAQAAHSIEMPVRALHNRPRDRAAAHLAECRMQQIVEDVERAGVGGVAGGLLARDDRAELDDVGAVRALGGQADCGALERLAQELRVVDSGHADRADEGAELRDDLDELVVAQARERLADGGPADAELLGDLVLGDLPAGLELG